MMFRSYENRLDRALVVFTCDDNAALLRAICCNPVTSYVRKCDNGSVSVPKHATENVAKHLESHGWTRAA